VQVDALFLSFTASQIIQLQGKNKTSLQWGIAREYGNKNKNNLFLEALIGIPPYKREDAWRGIHLFCKDRVRRRKPVPLSTTNNNN
jgi:hypothetical protein